MKPDELMETLKAYSGGSRFAWKLEYRSAIIVSLVRALVGVAMAALVVCGTRIAIPILAAWHEKDIDLDIVHSATNITLFVMAIIAIGLSVALVYAVKAVLIRNLPPGVPDDAYIEQLQGANTIARDRAKHLGEALGDANDAIQDRDQRIQELHRLAIRMLRQGKLDDARNLQNELERIMKTSK